MTTDTDGSYSCRQEYDGSERWIHNSVPPLPVRSK